MDANTCKHDEGHADNVAVAKRPGQGGEPAECQKGKRSQRETGGCMDANTCKHDKGHANNAAVASRGLNW